MFLSAHTLQNVFSGEKRVGVIFHASKEIIDLISDNLFKQTPDTLSDPRSVYFVYYDLMVAIGLKHLYW